MRGTAPFGCAGLGVGSWYSHPYYYGYPNRGPTYYGYLAPLPAPVPAPVRSRPRRIATPTAIATRASLTWGVASQVKGWACARYGSVSFPRLGLRKSVEF